MEHFIDLANRRYSCRKYSSDRVPSREDILNVVEAARVAPSACNKQPWRFIVVSSEGPEREAVIGSYPREWISSAPVYIICLGDIMEGWSRAVDRHSHIDVDLAIAVEHMCLEATSRGMGSCWVCNFDPYVIRREFGIPGNYAIVAILALGYPEEGAAVPQKVRKPMDDILVKWI